MFTCVCGYILYICIFDVLAGKKVLDPLELKLEVMGAGETAQ